MTPRFCRARFCCLEVAVSTLLCTQESIVISQYGLIILALSDIDGRIPPSTEWGPTTASSCIFRKLLNDSIRHPGCVPVFGQYWNDGDT